MATGAIHIRGADGMILGIQDIGGTITGDRPGHGNLLGVGDHPGHGGLHGVGDHPGHGGHPGHGHRLVLTTRVIRELPDIHVHPMV